MECVVPWERVVEWLERQPNAHETHEWFLTPACRCCGIELLYCKGEERPEHEDQRCEQHIGRNPCALEGCQRTRDAPEAGPGKFHYANDQHVCGEHWRRFVPPKSRLRRAYNAYWRQAKKHGWNYRGRLGRHPRLDWRFNRFWAALIMMMRRKADPASDVLDMTEINRIMGW